MLHKNIFSQDNNQIIIVSNLKNATKATLTFYDKNNKILETEAFIGKNGMTNDKKEGDGKTPEGIFDLGVFFGTHNKEDIGLNENVQYIRINKNLYWVDDKHSKYYNQLVDITQVRKDWNTAEHLIEYPKQYEYAIEIKTNSKNIPGNRKCDIFTLQCKQTNSRLYCNR